MEAVKIIAVSILAAICYGIIHDQITARICVEYFTVGHPRLIVSDSPTVLGIFWGIVATWWVGLALGIGLAISARVGKRPKRSVSDLIRPILKLMGCMFCVAILAGGIGYLTASNGTFRLVDHLANRIPPEKHIPFLIDGWAHGGSYLAGLIGGIVLWISVWRGRANSATN